MSKQVNLKVSEDVSKRLDQFCQEQDLSRPKALERMLDVMAFDQAKKSLGNRELEIEEFERHIDHLKDTYLNSLTLCAEAEERAEDSLKKEIETLEMQTKNLQQQIGALTAEKDAANRTVSELKAERQRLQSELDTQKSLVASQRKELQAAASLQNLIAQMQALNEQRKAEAQVDDSRAKQPAKAKADDSSAKQTAKAPRRKASSDKVSGTT